MRCIYHYFDNMEGRHYCTYEPENPITCVFGWSELMDNYEELAAARCRYYDSEAQWIVAYSPDNARTSTRSQTIAGPFDTYDEAFAVASKTNNTFMVPLRQESAIKMLVIKKAFELLTSKHAALRALDAETYTDLTADDHLVRMIVKDLRMIEPTAFWNLIDAAVTTNTGKFATLNEKLYDSIEKALIEKQGSITAMITDYGINDPVVTPEELTTLILSTIQSHTPETFSEYIDTIKGSNTDTLKDIKDEVWDTLEEMLYGPEEET